MIMTKEKIIYLILKIFSKAWLYCLRKYYVKNAIICKDVDIKKIKSVGFYLDNKDLVHVGDHLFFEPIMQLFKNNNIDTYVCVTEIMSDYFKQVGYKVTSKKNILKCDIVISPFQLAINMRNNKRSNIFFLDTNNLSIQGPISNYFVNSFIDILQIKVSLENNTEYVVNKIKSKNDILDKDKKWFLYSDNVHSGFFKINGAFRKVLINEAIKKINDGYNIAIVGTKRDLAEKNFYSEFKNFDIRGKTNVVQLFEMFNSDNVVGSISFDTAIAHIGILYKKETIIKLRKNFKLNNVFIKKSILPSYKRINNIIKYV